LLRSAQEQISKPYYEPYLKATEPLYTSPSRVSLENANQILTYRVTGVAAANFPLDSMNNFQADLLELDFKHEARVGTTRSTRADNS